MLGLDHTASMAVTRPLIPAGPMLLGFKPLKCFAMSIFCALVQIAITKNVNAERSFFINGDFVTGNFLNNRLISKKLFYYKPGITFWLNGNRQHDFIISVEAILFSCPLVIFNGEGCRSC